MNPRTHRSRHANRCRPGTLALGLLAAALAGTAAQAARIGHSRIVSAPGQPLQIEVPVQELSAEDAGSLQARPAAAQAWRQAGLNPPVPLEALHADIESGADPARRVIRVRADQPAAGAVVDLLLEISSASGQRQVQVSFLQPSGAAPAPAAASVPGASRSAAGSSVNVRRGDTLFGIARRHQVAGASVYQMLAALYQANPQAFIRNNMNLVKAGATLALPDAAAARAIDPAEARRLFGEHAEAFARYRAGMAGTVGAGVAVSAGATASGRVGQDESAPAAAQAAPQDRLRLSAAQGGAAQGDGQQDERAAAGKALREGEARVAQAQRNVDELNQALGAGGSPAGGSAAGAGNGTAPGDAASGGGAAGSGSGAAGGPAGQAAAAASASGGAGQGAPGSDGAGNAASATGAAASAQGADSGSSGTTPDAAAAGTGPAAGATGASSPGTGSGSQGASGSGAASGTTAAAGQGAAASAADAVPASGEPAASRGWLMDNLLIVVTAVLALLAFVIAWLMRRAGARRDDQYEDDLPYDDGGAAGAAFKERLESIDLDLDDDGKGAAPGESRPS